MFRSKDNIVHRAKIFTESVIDQIVSTEPHLKIKGVESDYDKSFKHVCLGISASGPTKRWDIENYIKLCEELTKTKKCKFYIAGGKNDIDLIKSFLVIGIINKNPIKSVRNPGIISSRAAKANAAPEIIS